MHYLSNTVLAVSIARWSVPSSSHCQIEPPVCTRRTPHGPSWNCRCVSMHHPVTGTIRSAPGSVALGSRTFGNTTVPLVPLQFHSRPDARPPNNSVHHNKQADSLAIHAHLSIHNNHQPSPSFLTITVSHCSNNRTNKLCKKKIYWLCCAPIRRRLFLVGFVSVCVVVVWFYLGPCVLFLFGSRYRSKLRFLFLV